jgi:hypothetical protein
MLFMFAIRYVDQFSRSLYVEYKKRGIDVQCQVLIPLRWYCFILVRILCIDMMFNIIASSFKVKQYSLDFLRHTVMIMTRTIKDGDPIFRFVQIILNENYFIF